MISFPRSGCFKSFGQYSGDELEKEPRTSEENANACQARCAATEGCSFFSFKEVRGWCGMSSRDAELTYEKGIVGGPVACNTGGSVLQSMDYFSNPLDEESLVGTSSCTTSGGTADGAPCSFPFKYGGVTYVNCTSVSHDQVL